MTQTEIRVSKKLLAGFLIFGVLLALIAAEIGCRAFIFYLKGHGQSVKELLDKSSKENLSEQKNFSNLRGLIKPSSVKDMVYELKPNLSGNFLGQEYQSNSHGMRDKEYSLDKPANTVRIAGIGDSVMFGWGVKENQSYLALIENELNTNISQNKKYEVLNFGTPGYNTAMQIALLKNKASLFKPDLIILHVVNNDLEVPLFMMRPDDFFTVKKSFLWNLIFPKNSNSLVRLDRNIESDILEEYRHLSGHAAFVNALKDLGNYTLQHNIPVLIMHGMLGSQMIKALKKTSKNFGFKIVNVKPYIEQILKENNIPDDKPSRIKALQVSKSDPHPNALGHMAYAKALLNEMNLAY